MGFLICGFTNSRFGCCVSWLFLCCDGVQFICAILAYACFFQHIIIRSRFTYFNVEYSALICATIHLSISVFLFLSDVIFKNDVLYILGHSSSTVGHVTTVATFGTMETNPQVQVANIDINSQDQDQIQVGEEGNCLQYCLQYFKQNPWSLYRKHYIITSVKIICIVLDIVILVKFNDSWKCAYYKC